MHIEVLKVVNFRNYDEQMIELCPNINLFYGLNGQGKTNILEAIYYCAIGKSFRTSKNKQLIKWEKDNMYTGCSLISNKGKRLIEINQDINNK